MYEKQTTLKNVNNCVDSMTADNFYFNFYAKMTIWEFLASKINEIVRYSLKFCRVPTLLSDGAIHKFGIHLALSDACSQSNCRNSVQFLRFWAKGPSTNLSFIFEYLMPDLCVDRDGWGWAEGGEDRARITSYLNNSWPPKSLILEARNSNMASKIKFLE